MAREQDATNRSSNSYPARYEHSSLILTSNLPFSRRGGAVSDHVAAAAMIDRIVDHAVVFTRKGNSYRLRNTESTHCPATATTARQTNQQPPSGRFSKSATAPELEQR
ncbi:ATP-binding protein [Nocardia sp. NPDC049220]|uniref:ATP-binding protein n=1 Tax=Nocardia sp. NPDC049220 TaxID=3155273 RepID=UPI0033E3C3A3